MLWRMWRQGNKNVELINQAMIQLSKEYEGYLGFSDKSRNILYPVQFLLKKVGEEIKAIKILNNCVLFGDEQGNTLGALV